MRTILSVAVAIFIALHSLNTTAAQMIIAHRGASNDAPENTLAAFKLAWEKKADGIEGDFHLTADQQIVCVHDKDTERVCPNSPKRIIADTDLATLRDMDVGSWKDAKFAGEKIPTLEEVLSIVPSGKQIFVEIKCGPEILPLLKEQLSQSGLKPEQIAILCFKTEVIKQVRQLMPEYRAYWLTDYTFIGKGKRQTWSPSLKKVLQVLAETDATGLDSRGHKKIVDQAFVAAIKKTGAEFHCWTINDALFALQLQSFGVNSLTTDFPEMIRSRIESNITERITP